MKHQHRNQHRILYVEDNPDLLELVQRLLEKELPCTVDVCATAYGAEGMLNQNCYDLVICDFALPGELGTTVIEKVLERDVGQPVMLMTEYRSSEIKDEVNRISERFNRPVPVSAKFSELSCPLAFAELVRKMLNVNFCESRAAQASRDSNSPQPPKPERRLRLASECVTAARRAVTGLTSGESRIAGAR